MKMSIVIQKCRLFLSLLLSLTCLSAHTEGLLYPQHIKTNGKLHLSHSDSLTDNRIYKVKFVRAIKIPGGYLLRGFAIQKSHKTKITILSTKSPSVNMESCTPLKTNKTYTLAVRSYFDNSNEYAASFHYPQTLNVLLYDSVLCIPIEDPIVPLHLSPNISGLFFNDNPFTDDLTLDTLGLASALSSFMLSLANKKDSVWNYADFSCLSDQFNKYQIGKRYTTSSKNGSRIVTKWYYLKYGQQKYDTSTLMQTIYNFCELEHLFCEEMMEPLSPKKINILYAEGDTILIKTEWMICLHQKEVIFQVLKKDTGFMIVGLCTPYLIPATIINY